VMMMVVVVVLLLLQMAERERCTGCCSFSFLCRCTSFSFFLHECCNKTSRGRRWQETEEEWRWRWQCWGRWQLWCCSYSGCCFKAEGGEMVKRIVIFSSVIYSLVPLFLCWFRFCFCSFTLLPPSKSPGSFLSFSPKFPPYLYSPFLFIGAGREGHLTPAMAQGKVATLPMSWHRVGWLGRVWDVACVRKKKGRRQEKIFKIFLFPCLCTRRGRRWTMSFKNDTVSFFFLTV
jgi:hypothetical protein